MPNRKPLAQAETIRMNNTLYAIRWPLDETGKETGDDLVTDNIEFITCPLGELTEADARLVSVIGAKDGRSWDARAEMAEAMRAKADEHGDSYAVFDDDGRPEDFFCPFVLVHAAKAVAATWEEHAEASHWRTHDEHYQHGTWG
jgi:hypothetical protein